LFPDERVHDGEPMIRARALMPVTTPQPATGRWAVVAALATWTVFGAGFVSAAPPAAPIAIPDTIAQRMQPCSACHGKEGRATGQGFFPRIAGKPAGYLYNQLDNFRSGRRANATMTYFVEQMSDDYLREIAAWFSSLDLPYAPPQTVGAPASEIALGETLVRRGDAANGLPACVQCHGAAMTGIAPAIPGLLGLPRGYLVEQFGAWRTGQRKALAPDCMAKIATTLSPSDISAVATWLSSQPVSQPPAAADTLVRPLPMACGSVPQ
jgi:cytochrome c553